MGRGVFASKNYKKGDVVSTCPVILVPKSEITKNNLLYLYVYSWNTRYYALSLGLGSLFNHRTQSNIDFNKDKNSDSLIFTAKKEIKKGDQLFINYGYNPINATNRYLKNIKKRLK